MKLDDAKFRDPGVLNRKSNASGRISILSESTRYEITHINIDNLIAYHKQARKVFDDSELNALAETIREHGIRQPLTVIRSKSEPDKFEVVSGERRLRASKIVNLKNIPCIIFENSEQAEEIALIENIQRSDLHPVEMASALSLLLDKYKWGGQTELSKKIGLSNSQISELLKIGGLSESIKQTMLNKNFRGRENLRALFKIESDAKKIDYINSFDSEIVLGKRAKDKSSSFAVLRITLSENSFKVQKNGLSKLDDLQKRQVKEELLEILKEVS